MILFNLAIFVSAPRGLGSAGGGPKEPPEPGVGSVWPGCPAPPGSFPWAMGWRVRAGGCRWDLQSPEGCAVLWGQWLLHQLPLSLAVLKLGKVLSAPEEGLCCVPAWGFYLCTGADPVCDVALGFLDVGNLGHMWALLPPRAKGSGAPRAALALQEPPGRGCGRIQLWEGGGAEPPSSPCWNTPSAKLLHGFEWWGRSSWQRGGLAQTAGSLELTLSVWRNLWQPAGGQCVNWPCGVMGRLVAL